MKQFLVQSRKVHFALVLFVLFSAFPARPVYSKVAPGLAGIFSIIPGLGQTANGSPGEGVLWFTSSLGLFFSGNPYMQQAGFDLWQYNMYDAYRDAGADDTAPHNVFVNYFNAYNPLNVIDPIGGPIVGVAAVYGARNNYPALKNGAKVAMYGFVGLGEEGFFRGFLFPAFSDVFFNSKFLGAVTSSAAFAYAHALGGPENLSAPVLGQRFLFGMLMCWQLYRNKFDLRNNIFAHTWYDILVDNGEVIGKMSYTLHF
ncbi:MAG: CPBP family intramembrane glutamic endopeptidase [Bacteriovoracia bacterium]